MSISRVCDCLATDVCHIRTLDCRERQGMVVGLGKGKWDGETKQMRGNEKGGWTETRVTLRWNIVKGDHIKLQSLNIY